MTGPLVDQPAATVRRWRPTRLLVLLVVASMLAMWGYVLYLAFVPGRQPPPDRLADPTFATAAQARCRKTLDLVAVLPHAADTPSAPKRAAVITKANGYFAEMLDDLDLLAPVGGDGRLVHEWVTDWRTYLANRAAYARDLLTDPRARLLVSPKGREQVTEHLDAFAGDNRMPACATPLDV